MIKEYIHLSKWYFRKKPNGHWKDGAECGHGSFHARVTNDLSIITCPKCIDRVPDIWKNKVILWKNI